jgi:uncharacterized protein (DUF305 family)
MMVISSASFAQANHDHKHDSSREVPMTMEKAMEKSKTEMGTMKITGDTDRDFAMMMRMHHQHGVDMANVELAKGKDPKLKAMARKVIKEQNKEIAELDKWLAKQQAPAAKETTGSK